MSDKFEEFLIELASRPDLLWALDENPDSVLDDIELSDIEKSVLRSGDTAMLRTALCADLSPAIAVVAVVVVVTAVV